MNRRHLTGLLLLASLWGASFLFMRISAPEFGPVALACVRVLGAASVLAPLALWQGHWKALRENAVPLLVVGLTAVALPSLCYSFAALSITAGLSSIFNASTPLFGAAIAWLWLRERLSAPRMLGLGVGFVGVLWLAWDKASLRDDAAGMSATWAIVACLGATLMYGYSANYTKRRLGHVAPMVVAAGSQVASAIVLLPLTLFAWPTASPSALAWGSAALLAVLCTGIGYAIYFRLIAQAGPMYAISVTFLIPIFGVLWGALFLNEAITAAMLVGCTVILAGTALTTEIWRRK